MHDEKHEDLEKVKAIKEHLIHVAYNYNGNDTNYMMQLSDMIKDFSETEKNCAKKCYYEKMTERLCEEEMNERMGYDNWRYSSGRFAPKGHGTYTPPLHGFMPPIYTKADARMPMGDGRAYPHDMMPDVWDYNDFVGYRPGRYGMTEHSDMHSLEHIKEAYRNAGPEEQAKMKAELSHIFNEPTKLV